MENHPYVLVDDVEEKLAGNAEAKRGARFARSLRGRSQRQLLHATDEDGIEEHGGVGGGTRQGADAIETGRKWNDVGDGNAPEGGFEADDAAEGGRDADGAPSIRADTAAAQTGGNRCRRTSAGTAGNAGKIPRIARGAEVRIVGGDAVGEFVEVGLAEDDDPSFFELGDQGGIVLGNEVLQDF